MTKEEIQHLLDHSNPQSEEALEFSSMLQFHDLGWQCEYAMNEDESNSFLGRKDFTEVVLDKYLLPKLKDLNSGKPDAKGYLVYSRSSEDFFIASCIAACVGKWLVFCDIQITFSLLCA